MTQDEAKMDVEAPVVPAPVAPAFDYFSDDSDGTYDAAVFSNAALPEFASDAALAEFERELNASVLAMLVIADNLGVGDVPANAAA